MRILKDPVTALIVVLVLAASSAFGFSKDARFGVLLLGLAAIAFLIALAEWRTKGRKLGVRSPVFWKSALPTASPPARPENDLVAQVEALMGMPIDLHPQIRARTAIYFGPSKLDAAERSVLVTWANRALTGGELEYHVEPYVRLRDQYWRLQCSDKNDYPPRRLDGTIKASDRETLDALAAAHRTMINQLRQGARRG